MSGTKRSTRYVVLHHTGYGKSHFDLMVEPSPGAARLLTWRTPVWPLAEGTLLTALGEHRRAYLAYEGEVSGGRGQVRRAASGSCECSVEADGSVRIRFGDEGEWLLGQHARRA